MNHRIFSNHFQAAYVVDDLDRGMAFFRDNCAIANWHIIDVAGPGSPANAIATAYVDNLMYELIEPSAEPSLYQGWLKDGGSGIRFHHFGFLVKTQADWDATMQALAERKIADAMSGTIPDIIDYHYADTTDLLGHYCEYVHLRPGGLGMFDPVPQN